MAALTSSGIFAVVFNNNFYLKLVTAIVSAISLFITTYFKSYDLKSLQKQYKKSALDWLELRENMMTALCDIALNKYDEDELISRREEFIKRKIEIAKLSLDCSNRAVKKASKDLKVRGDNDYSDNEIDSFLPQLARKNK